MKSTKQVFFNLWFLTHKCKRPLREHAELAVSVQHLIGEPCLAINYIKDVAVYK